MAYMWCKLGLDHVLNRKFNYKIYMWERIMCPSNKMMGAVKQYSGVELWYIVGKVYVMYKHIVVLINVFFMCFLQIPLSYRSHRICIMDLRGVSKVMIFWVVHVNKCKELCHVSSEVWSIIYHGRYFWWIALPCSTHKMNLLLWKQYLYQHI